MTAALVLFLLRLSLGQIFLLHGGFKLAGKEGTDLAFGKLLGTVEVLAGALMVLGWYVELAGVIIAITMLGALFFKFFIWKGQAWKGNIEYDALILFAALLVATLGPGAFVLTL